ncbi:SRPBCC domain-containing protein [Streptomyces sp. SID13031]|uniref:SRPBCC family protein n=1 Tax=Streptomyces sp. SID13031 TaxID=2706046 RepID=UPI0013CA005D|nr:SRPBCC domain-containing protein [Streptomyces sp. SID13031]NEA37116.1 SRPBCC domain-containing protein [Streptomyces sp. SID13031]
MSTAGLTKDSGWEVGVSKTLQYSVPELWDLLTSPNGLTLWLGEGAELAVGSRYETADGTTGEVRSYREHDRIRVTWQPADWSHDSTVQLALSGSGPKTVLRFHQERLADADERTRQRTHWQDVMTTVIERLGSDRGQ